MTYEARYLQVSTMKCGLLPLCHEAMVVGEIGYADYEGNTNSVSREFQSRAKVTLHPFSGPFSQMSQQNVRHCHRSVDRL